MKKPGKYRHFTLHDLAPGVFAAQATPGQGAYSNAGIIDLGGQTVVFDTFMTHPAARELREAAVMLTGREPQYVINSHSHSDHWGGNQVFSHKTAILSTPRTQELMQEEIDEWLDAIIQDPQLVTEDIRALEKRLVTVENESLREALTRTLSSRKHFLESLPDFKPTRSNETFEGPLELKGSGKAIELRVVEGGHTASDIYMVLPEERIAFLGDLAFFTSHPFLPSSDLQGWSAALAAIGQMDLDVIVPGHGPSGSTNDLLLVKQYLIDLSEIARHVIREGGSEEDAAGVSIPAPFNTWIDGMSRFETNMRFLHRRLSEPMRQE